jgi:hypothetical protein
MVTSRLFCALVPTLAPVLALAQSSTQGVVAYIHSPTWYQFGGHAQPVGDVDGDGLGDLVITGKLTQGGFIVGGTYSGRNGSTINFWTGSGSHDLLSGPLRAVGDIDQDGQCDVIYGSSGTTGQGVIGKAVVFSGRTGHQKLLLSDMLADTEFAKTLDGAGDVDLDGVPDLVVGAPNYNPWGSPRGRATVFSGAPGAVLWNLDLFGAGIVHFASCAKHVAGAGDADSDGFTDIAMTTAISGSPNSIRVFSGATAGSLYEVATNVSNSQGWRTLGIAGDVNGDGHADLLVGDNSHTTPLGEKTGACRVYLGPSGIVAHEILGTFPNAINVLSFGFNVEGAADWDGDGNDDFLCTSLEQLPSTFPKNASVTRVFSGFNAALLETVVSTSATPAYISPDINGDGDLDLSGPGIGVAPYGNGEGAAYAFTTVCGSLSTVGTGCSSGTLIPTLGILTDCVARGATLTLTVQASFFTPVAFLVFGTTTAAAPLGGSCVLYPSGTLNVVSMPLSFAGAGFATGQIPKSFGPSDFTLQAFVPAPGSPLGFAASSALVFDVP